MRSTPGSAVRISRSASRKPPPNRQGSLFAEKIAGEFTHDYPTAIEQQPGALSLYRRVLASQPNHSVTLITVGDLTNIRDLLISKADEFSPLDGVELARTKVKNWFCMGSRYPADLDPNAWGNFKMDPHATVQAIQDWPGSIIFTGGGKFAQMLSTGESLSKLTKRNPVRRAYELYFGGKAKNRHSADQITVMVALGGSISPWKLVKEGHNHIFSNGTHEWRVNSDNKNHSYVSALDDNATPKAVADEIESLMQHIPRN